MRSKHLPLIAALALALPLAACAPQLAEAAPQAPRDGRARRGTEVSTVT